MSRPGVSRRCCAAISPVVYICAMPGESSSPLSANVVPKLVLRGHQPVLLAGGVEVVRAGGGQASTTSGPNLMNGPTVLQTTWAPLNRSVSASTVCSTSTMSCSAVSMPGIRVDARPAAGPCCGRRRRTGR